MLSPWYASMPPGVYKVPYDLIFFPTPIFRIFISFLIISVSFPSSPLENIPYSLNIIDQMILLPLILFFHVIFFPKVLKYTFPVHNLKFFPKHFMGGNKELYTPLPQKLFFPNRINSDGEKN